MGLCMGMSLRKRKKNVGCFVRHKQASQIAGASRLDIPGIPYVAGVELVFLPSRWWSVGMNTGGWIGRGFAYFCQINEDLVDTWYGGLGAVWGGANGVQCIAPSSIYRSCDRFSGGTLTPAAVIVSRDSKTAKSSQAVVSEDQASTIDVRRVDKRAVKNGIEMVLLHGNH